MTPPMPEPAEAVRIVARAICNRGEEDQSREACLHCEDCAHVGLAALQAAGYAILSPITAAGDLREKIAEVLEAYWYEGEDIEPAADAALSILSSALAARDEEIARLRADLKSERDYAHRLQVALTGIAGGGSENFMKHGESFRADVQACVNRINRRFDSLNDTIRRFARAGNDARAALSTTRQEQSDAE